MCLHPKFARTARGLLLVNCGSCEECKKERQNDIAHRLYLASQQNPNIHFFTLTYSNEKCPLFVRATDYFLEKYGYLTSVKIPYRRDKEIDDNLNYRLVYDYDNEPSYYLKDFYSDCTATCGDYTFNLLGEYIDEPGFDYTWSSRLRRGFWNWTDENRCLPKPEHLLKFVGDEYAGEFTVTPSLRNEDVCKWLRSFRKKDGKHRSFDFKYYFCGEYGPKTDRPHYHMITYGLTDSQAEEMRRRWIKWYGDPNNDYGTTVSRVSMYDDHVSRAARYVGKYIAKGKFESSNVKNRFAVPPRAVSSRAMYEVTCDMFNYYSGKDLFADEVRRYKKSFEWRTMSTFRQDKVTDDGIWRFLPAEYYTDEKLSVLAERQYYTLPSDPGRRYRIGKSIKNKVFKYKDYEKIDYITGEVKERLLSTPLSLALSEFVRHRASENLLGEFRQVRQENLGVSFDEIVKSYSKFYNEASKEREKIMDKINWSTYKASYF